MSSTSSGMTTEKHFPTANGSGVAMFDYDGDGLLDLYFATATPLPVGSAEMGANRLYKNLGGGRFADTTGSSGLGFRGFCHGVVVGDVDNDGDQDVFLCNYGREQTLCEQWRRDLRRCQRAGRHRPPGVVLRGGVPGLRRRRRPRPVRGQLRRVDLSGRRQVLRRPGAEDPALLLASVGRTVKHYLYRNNGDGTFTDVYDRAILSTDPETGRPRPRSDGHGFGVVAADLDGDGRVDLYVANDMNPNFVFLNNGDGTFRDATDTSGAAFDERGQAQSGMGVDAEDVDGDGRPELFVTNFAGEYNTLYQNMGNGTFMDATPVLRDGGRHPAVGRLGHGPGGLRQRRLAGQLRGQWPRRRQPTPPRRADRLCRAALLFLNLKGKRFRLATRDAGPYFDGRHVGRGVAFGDLDNDGGHRRRRQPQGWPAGRPSQRHADGEPLGPPGAARDPSNRDAVGARVEVVADGRTITRQRKGGVSMLSAHDPRLTVGLGAAGSIEALTVRWPSGAVSALKGLGVDRAHAIVEPTAGPERAVPATKP